MWSFGRSASNKKFIKSNQTEKKKEGFCALIINAFCRGEKPVKNLRIYTEWDWMDVWWLRINFGKTTIIMVTQATKKEQRFFTFFKTSDWMTIAANIDCVREACCSKIISISKRICVTQVFFF